MTAALQHFIILRSELFSLFFQRFPMKPVGFFSWVRSSTIEKTFSCYSWIGRGKRMAIQWKVWKYGDDVNTDVIFSGKYTYTINDPNEMAKHALEDPDPHFTGNVREDDIIVAGKTCGGGSSREQAATCIKFAKVGAVVAKSF
jgi:hypothetical protein